MTYLPWLHTPDETRAWIRETVLEECEVWVVEDAARIVGFAALRDGWLDHVYVAPGRQGQGIGTALFARATERLPHGFRLWSFQRNQAALRFYERLGCRVVETTDGSGNEREPDALLEWSPAAV